jgi:hypothetical protein
VRTDAFARQDDSAPGRDGHGLYAIADGELEAAGFVFQFGNVNLRLALPADADEGDVRPDRRNRPLDGLALLDSTRLDGRLEHRREVFFLLAHGTPSDLANGDQTIIRRRREVRMGGNCLSGALSKVGDKEERARRLAPLP